MVDLSDNFKEFIEKIQLTDWQVEEGENKAENVCKTLHHHYYDDEYDGSTKLIMGSFGKDTAIRPPSDVDVIFKLPKDEKERYDNYSGNGQSQLLQDVKKILLQTYPSTVIKGDGPVVVVEFDSYKIEVNPSIEEIIGYSVPITRNGGKWERIDPISEKVEIDNADNKSSGNARNLIKMIKKWKNYCNVPIKSFHIELIVVDFLREETLHNCDFRFYHIILYHFFQFLLKSKNMNKTHPCEYKIINYGDEWVSKARIACKNARLALISESQDEAIDYLRKIFGYSFPD